MAEHPAARAGRADGCFLRRDDGCALAFWAAAVVLPGGIPGVIGLVGYGYDDDLRHVPHPRGRHRRPVVAVGTPSPAARHAVALEASTIYFCIAVLVSIFFNYARRDDARPNPLAPPPLALFDGAAAGAASRSADSRHRHPLDQMTTSFRCLSCPISADRPGDR
jgi:hypothetical protein